MLPMDGVNDSILSIVFDDVTDYRATPVDHSIISEFRLSLKVLSGPVQSSKTWSDSGWAIVYIF